MSLRKTAKIGTPYAIYVGGSFTWVVLKVNAPSKKPEGYATWFVAAKSPYTSGSWEYGDTYAVDVLSHGSLVDATPEFSEYLSKHGVDAAIGETMRWRYE